MGLQLLPEEKIVFRTKPHWMIFGWLIPVFAICLWFSWGVLFTEFGIFLIGFGIATLLYYLVIYKSSHYVITNKRVYFRSGSVNIVTSIIPLDEIKNIDLRQDSIGQSFKYGDILIFSTTFPITLHYVKDIHTFYNHLSAQIDKIRHNE